MHLYFKGWLKDVKKKKQAQKEEVGHFLESTVEKKMFLQELV